MTIFPLLITSYSIFAAVHQASAFLVSPVPGFALATHRGKTAPSMQPNSQRCSCCEISSTTGSTVKRRDLLASAVASFVASTAISPGVAVASTDELTSYKDPDCRFQISVPSKWEQTTQQLPDRRKIVLFVDPTQKDMPEQDKTLMFIAYTPIRDDFTSLSSFGSVDQVGQMTILPKGGVVSTEEATESNLLAAESKKNAYFFDYTMRVPGESMIHHRAIFSLAQGATGGAGSLLVTVNLQTPESRYGELKTTVDAMFDSFGKI